MISLVPLLKRSALTLSLLSPLLLTGCGGDYNPELDGVPGSSGAKTGLQLSVPVPPTVSYPDDGTGTTQMTLQFSVRDRAGLPLGANEFDAQLLVDDRPVDVESGLKQTAEDLDVNLYFGMVLDASYSMIQHTPPAFEPMKTAASNSYQEVIDLWKNRPGKVKFSLIWFDSVINQAHQGVGGMGDWLPVDILTIPTPSSDGGYTKLHSAVEVMAKKMKSDYDNGIFRGPRDQYVMLVFSDGADNYSWFDNSSQPMLRATRNGASFYQFGTAGPVSKKPADALQSAVDAISNHPRLTTHVIGLGSEIKSSELQQLATAGHGVFQSNPSSEKVAELFQRVMKEFTTLQTRLATVPLSPGEYKISLVVTNKATGESGRYDFKIYAGDKGAKVIKAPL